MSFDEDPLDLLEDDGDGVIETILLSEEEEKPVLERTGCSFLLLSLGSSVGVGWWLIDYYFA